MSHCFFIQNQNKDDYNPVSPLHTTCPTLSLAQEMTSGSRSRMPVSRSCSSLWQSQHGGSYGGGGELRLRLAAVEQHRIRPAQRLQPTVLPRREQLRPDTMRHQRRVPAFRTAGQELHQCVGDPEEGTGDTWTHHIIRKHTVYCGDQVAGNAPNHRQTRLNSYQKLDTLKRR